MLEHYFANPALLLLIPGIFIVMLIFGFSFKKLFFIRFLVFTFIIFALAEPHMPEQLFGGETPYLVVLDDVSTSFSLFEQNTGKTVYNQLQRNNVGYYIVGKDLVSALGDDLEKHIKQQRNILLISDGQINKGSTLGDVAIRAQEYNVSVNIIEPTPVEEDRSIIIKGPDKVGEGVISTFTVSSSGTGTERPMVLFVDGKQVAQSSGEIHYDQLLSSGYHQLKAELLGDDHFSENNVYYKVVKVVDKPRILFLGEANSPLYKTLQKFYTIETGELYGLDNYHAVVIDNMPLNALQERIAELTSYVQDGNGLFVVGGKNSFEYGNYPGSAFETLIPTVTSGVGKQEGYVNVILLLDISRSGEEGYGTTTTVEITKNLASSALNDIDPEHHVGVVAFDFESYIIEPLGKLAEKDLPAVKTSIFQLVPSGVTELGEGLEKAIAMLQDRTGAKQILLISDGRTNMRDHADAMVNKAKKENINIYSIGVGQDISKAYLENLSWETGGNYFPAFQSSKIAFFFGDSEAQKKETMQLLIENDKHFITEDVIPNGKVTGYNEVVPKNSAQLLVSANGQPLLNTWRAGLGRVAVLATDNGNKWSGELYSGSNSPLITRTFSWATGDPERKEPYFVEIIDARAEELFTISITSKTRPPFEELQFEKIGKDMYTSSTSKQTPGFHTLGEHVYAVNYNSEYASLGFNEELRTLVQATGGTVAQTEDVEETIQNYLKTQSAAQAARDSSLIWPFILLALLTFLLDVWVRKSKEQKNI